MLSLTTYIGEEWSESIGRVDNGEGWPWYLDNELRDILNSIRLAGDFYLRPPWKDDSRLYRALKNSQVKPIQPEGHSSIKLYHLPTFANDPTWYIRRRGINRWLISNYSEWRVREQYYDPRAYRFRTIHGWFFYIGDVDRCLAVRNHGPVWSWHTDPPAWTGMSGGPATDGSEHAMIVWNEDPTPFGYEGSAGTVVDMYDVRMGLNKFLD